MLKVEQSKGRNYIVGNTFPVKDALRAEGFRWDAERKGWWTQDAALAASMATRLNASPSSTMPVPRASASPAKPSGPAKPPATKQCWECGCRFTYADAKSGGGDWSESYCGC